MTAHPSELLDRLEAYYDLVPRATADIEEVGPFTLFVSRGGWPFYARPRLGLDVDITAADVSMLLERQCARDVPRAVEWVHETTPSLLAAARSAGVNLEECPLLALDTAALPGAADPRVRPVPAGDAALPLVVAAIHVGFGNPGTALGAAGPEARDARACDTAGSAARTAQLVRDGLSVLWGAFDPVAGPVGGGSHNPRGEVTEVVGVGVLPWFRRRGLAGALTAGLARDAVARGCTTVFCSAQDEEVAGVYEAVGFRRVGTACIGEAG